VEGMAGNRGSGRAGRKRRIIFELYTGRSLQVVGMVYTVGMDKNFGYDNLLSREETSKSCGSPKYPVQLAGLFAL